MENIEYPVSPAALVSTGITILIPRSCVFTINCTSAILTVLQISGAADDPVTRYAALLSLICALLSLLFGCMYIIRFGSMRKTYKAAEWALVSWFFMHLE